MKPTTLKAGLISGSLVRCMMLVLFCMPMQKLLAQNEVHNAGKVKNLILMIGDGMGPQQVGLLEVFLRRTRLPAYMGKNSALTQFARQGVLGLSMTGPANALVADSACSASQLASGVDSDSEMLGLDQWGNPVVSILERAKKAGKVTGLVSDTRITHATPAAFASHQWHRSVENAIALEMLQSNQVDIMLSGGLRHWLPQAVNQDTAIRKAVQSMINEPDLKLYSRRNDELNLLAMAKQQGYELAFNAEQLQSTQADKVLGLFAMSGMQNAIAFKYNQQRTQPSLAAMTKKALNILANSPDGFFLMIEGGQIDWAGHNNDAGWLLHEMLRFDEAVAAVYEWVKERDDTLVLITADHETGGFGFSYSRYDVPKGKKLPGLMFKEHVYKPNFNFGSIAIPDQIYQQKKNFADIWAQAKGHNKRPDAQDLVLAMNENSEFKIDYAQAEHILALEKNQYRDVHNKYLKAEMFPKVYDFKAFYVYVADVPLDLMGRQLATAQNVVWSSGTHTHTPVPVIAWGPEIWRNRFSTITHHTQLGQWMIESFIADKTE